MLNDRYNYSVSLIRRVADRWMIDPEDASAQAFHSELLGKGLGEHYLATKTQGELFYCVFLSGDVCHSDVYGWMITLNGWRLLDLDAYLQLSQQIWEEFALASSRGDIRQILYGIIDEKRLVLHSTPAPIDRNVEHSYHALTFTPKSKPKVRLDTTQGGSGNRSRGFGHVGIFIFVISLIVVFIFAAFLPRGGSSDSSSTNHVTSVEYEASNSASTSSSGVETTVDNASVEEKEEEVSNAYEAERLFRKYLLALGRHDYSGALECFEYPMPKFLSRRNLSAQDMYAEMVSYNQTNPVQDTNIINIEHLQDGSARIIFVWDRLMEGWSYERFRVVSVVKARETSEGWKLYSVGERSEKIE